MSEYCLPFVKVGGKFISYKSEKITEEMNAAQHAVKILGGKMDGQVEFTLPDSDIYRNLFIITKQKSTPAKFPRKAGLPSKEPLHKTGSKAPTLMSTDCYVLRTPTILPNIRISWDYHPTFMLISGRVLVFHPLMSKLMWARP